MKKLLIIFFCLLGMPSLRAEDNLKYYTKNFSSFARRLMHESDETEERKLYVLYLNDVPTYLPEREKVKRQKTNLMAHRIIPGKTPIWLAKKLIFHSKQSVETKSAVDFFSDLPKNQEHTYAILKDRMIFTETTAVPIQEKYKDKFSKHGILSGLKRKVHYAGEFKVIEHNGQIAVVINNDSGTYKPNKDNLGNLQKLFEANFADEKLQFIAQDFTQNLDPTATNSVAKD